MKTAIVVFPGTSGEHEVYQVLTQYDVQVEIVSDLTTSLDAYDGIIIPGGFAYGDYLRSGAIAKLSPIMTEIKKAAEDGKLVLGIGNGFQILLECNLLPGAMLPNADLKFKCCNVPVIVENNQTAFTCDYQEKAQLDLPIAHWAGNYYCDPVTLEQLEQQGQIVFRYHNNPNGSLNNIAGIINRKGNVLGIMARPERACDQLLGSVDGSKLFSSMIRSWRDSNGLL
ncbi:MAG: phosphoribosylformylglycinamidine synthase subunit PurQ [Firmicutes bacterium]|jgi:phosphoribosylformylglycinamidine synthase|nr:phosphoribosylformylglycinamidine synthase subunit PurQ [Bacillota bacterium]